MTQTTDEVFSAAERTFHAAGCKPKDVAGIVAKLETDYQVTLTVDGGLLTAHQNGAVASLGTIIGAYRAKFPREFYGESGTVNYKDDLQGDTEGKTRFIREHGFDAWNALPLNEKSASARHTPTDSIPSAFMNAKAYARLTVAEKCKLAGELGPAGIGKILNRR